MTHITEAVMDIVPSFREEFASLRRLAERAMAQIDDEAFFRTLAAEANSVALIAKHVGGNLRSRWTDFLITDGEKPDRNRDGEFERGAGDTRERIMAEWQAGWDTVDDTLASLRPEDLRREVVIRGQAHTVPRALTRSLAHTAGHVHQMILLCKHWQGGRWQTLSIARGQSTTFRPRGTEPHRR
jgi:hypothetical protein